MAYVGQVLLVSAIASVPFILGQQTTRGPWWLAGWL